MFVKEKLTKKHLGDCRDLGKGDILVLNWSRVSVEEEEEVLEKGVAVITHQSEYTSCH